LTETTLDNFGGDVYNMDEMQLYVIFD